MSRVRPSLVTQVPSVTPVILAGGDGSRLWPASRPDLPKQFIGLDGDRSLFQQTLLRCIQFEAFRAPIIVVGERHQHVVQRQIDELGLTPGALIVEPVGRDTTAAITMAAMAAAEDGQDNSLIAVFPSDHKITNEEAFRTVLSQAIVVAQRTGMLLTFGVKPTSPATGYGYIRQGAKLYEHQAHLVEDFVEKPNKALAEQYLAAGTYLWNSGMFLFPIDTFLAEMANYCQSTLVGVERALTGGHSDGYAIYPARDVFDEIEKRSIDYDLMEKTGLCAVMAFPSEWDDLGDWDAIWRTSRQDHSGNGTFGHVALKETRNSYIHTTGPLTSVIGMDNCIVVATPDAILVTEKSRASELKSMVQKLKRQERPEVCKHPGEIRPWGRFAPLHNGDAHQVKVIEVNPGGQLSLQKHRYRAEHWVVVSGQATVTIDDARITAGPGEHVHIPLGAVHRLENFSTSPVILIEIQTGTYFGEDDIIRLEDVYGREPEPEMATGNHSNQIDRTETVRAEGETS
ncbi:mannose-1-phosphate guanylyltransferase/mannose-6-phosphate isomerase [Coralliovum pocilloporae]|uniref:mannose-1-phosphate guanylyltransferase/mannose-6-phosphate isomerase n=1 Tax=Coralliovum pocilloporae TaxID=3066369 RepID=UPI003306A6C4